MHVLFVRGLGRSLGRCGGGGGGGSRVERGGRGAE